jgi:uncharacterized protein (TIGR02246 family)
MKRIICLAVVCFSTFAMAGPQEDAQAVFDKFLSDFTAADPDAVASHFGPNALFWGTNSRDLVSGTKSIHQYFSDAFKRLPGAKATPVGTVSVVPIADDVLAVSGIWQIERMVDGKAAISQDRNSVTLVKRDGRWLIASFTNSRRPAEQ